VYEHHQNRLIFFLVLSPHEGEPFAQYLTHYQNGLNTANSAKLNKVDTLRFIILFTDIPVKNRFILTYFRYH
jgi:hypothetical protein